MATCNCCGGTKWLDMGKRKNVRCASCGSLERTRIIKLFLDREGLPKPGSSILHFAPERGIAPILAAEGATDYDPVDFAPELFPHCKTRKIDLCTDAADLPRGRYDLIVHSHIAEHIPCNITAVLYHMHRALKPDGLHLMCIPFLGGNYEEDLGPLSPEDATRRFGQKDHVRRFGTADLALNLGMIFQLPASYSLLDWFSAEMLEECNIPVYAQSGFTPSTVLAMKKDDLLLVDA